MRLRNLALTIAVVLGVCAPVAHAEDVALVISNSMYRNFVDVENAEAVLAATPDLEGAGYKVIQVENATEAGLQEAITAFETALSEADRAIVVLSGGFLHTGSVTWFAPTDLRSPSLSAVGFEGLPVSAVLSYLQQKPGGAALFLASVGAEGPGGLVAKGVGEISVPQGVLLVQGDPKGIANSLSRDFLAEGVSLAGAVKRAGSSIRAKGYISQLSTLSATGEPTVGSSAIDATILAEQAYWQAVSDLNSKQAFQAYIDRYPDGEFAAVAGAKVQAINDATPKVTPEQQVEIDLKLTRSDRRRVQEQLSLLEYDTKGIDGLFGPATRSALKRWQSQNGAVASGYLTPKLLQKLRLQAEKRARRLADEARKKREQRDAADAAFWQATGANGNEADLLAYLKKYPDGLYAEPARSRLKAIEAGKRQNALASETALWDEAVQSNKIRDYRAYLTAYPDGTFKDTAVARIEEIKASRKDNEAVIAAKAEEASMPISPPMRILLETQLRKLKFDPGKIDGVFDKETRKAIRKYQKSRDIEVTGFLTRRTVVRLMAE
ncbi:MAG: peptidoglycan-binding protein [Rhodobacteraceae bacterium]|nr:peptidoglycan-binding protein [Paracoccaceae bacterium]